MAVGHRLVAVVHVLVDERLALRVHLIRLSLVHVELLLEEGLSAAAAADAGDDEDREEGDGRANDHGDQPALHGAVAVSPVERAAVVGDVARAARALGVVVAVLEGAAVRCRPVVVGAGLSEGEQEGA